MRNILRHNDRAVNHHTHSQNQARQWDNIQWNMAEIEKEKSNDNRGHHTDTDNQRRADISQEQYGNNENKQES